MRQPFYTLFVWCKRSVCLHWSETLLADLISNEDRESSVILKSSTWHPVKEKLVLLPGKARWPEHGSGSRLLPLPEQWAWAPPSLPPLIFKQGLINKSALLQKYFVTSGERRSINPHEHFLLLSVNTLGLVEIVPATDITDLWRDKHELIDDLSAGSISTTPRQDIFHVGNNKSYYWMSSNEGKLQ